MNMGEHQIHIFLRQLFETFAVGDNIPYIVVIVFNMRLLGRHLRVAVEYVSADFTALVVDLEQIVLLKFRASVRDQ